MAAERRNGGKVGFGFSLLEWSGVKLYWLTRFDCGGVFCGGLTRTGISFELRLGNCLGRREN